MSEIVSASQSSGSILMNTLFKAVKFIIISYIISVLLLAGLAVIIVYTGVSETVAGPAVKGITLFGAFLSALLTSKSSDSRGWLCGVITGSLNIFMLLVIGVATVGSDLFTASNMVLVLLGALCGLIGGIIGVNLGNR